MGEYFISFRIWGYLALVLSILSAINTYSNITGNPIAIFQVIPTWGWLTLLILGLVITPFFAFHKIRERLDRLENKRPCMRFVSSENVKTPLWGNVREIRMVIGEPRFTHAIFANDPKSSIKGSTAERVVAHLDFYDKSRSQLMFSLTGRWADTPERATVGLHVVDTNQINIAPNAMPRYLDVVLKYDDEDECYGLNNETPVRATAGPGWRDETRKLEPATYAVKIRLRGLNLDDVFWFSLVNPGKSSEVELKAVS